jgi:hypothetical protein
MKQTAVEWLIEELRGAHNGVITSELIEQAKEMEKEQITDAYRFGISDEYVIGSQRYYNETFKSE